MPSIFTTQTPSNPNATDGGTSYELGLKFRTSQAGQITAIRYWKANSETGTHVGKIWAATGGSPLATVTFTGETASGWQQQALSTPLNIQANTTYIVSVNCNSHFAITYDQLATSMVNGTLSTVVGNNGVFGSAGNFPTNSYRDSNYFRDIAFSVTATPTITKFSGDNQSGTVGTALANPLVVQVKNSAGNPQSGVTVNFAVTGGGGSVSPTSAVTNASGQASTTLTLGAAPGATSPVTNTVSASASGYGSVTFTATANPPAGVTTQTVFTTQTPSNQNATDGSTYELGMKFRSASAGQLVGIRYWKAASEGGTHVGNIWAATGGTPLTTVTFTNETASGWQQATLSSPLNIQANTTYVVSVNCNSHFAMTAGGLSSSTVNEDLSTVADGSNCLYGGIHDFPTSSYQNSNYFRDVLFVVGSGITKVSGDNQTGTSGTTLSNPLVVRVRGSGGSPQSGVTVNFAVTNGSGTVSPTSAVTNASGQASTTLTIGSIPAGPSSTIVVTATAPGIGNTSFSITALPPAGSENPIVLENSKTGSSNWRIDYFNQAGTEIAGYATATSVNKGSTLGLKVSLAQPGPYKIDVYRLGYYGGAGGRLMVSSGTLNGITQPALILTQGGNIQLYEGYNWSVSYNLAVGNDWTSGLYIAKLTDQTSGKESQIWFVVRNDSSTADILFQSSFNTFLAYNNGGMAVLGSSLYGYNSVGGQKALKVSYDRPFSQTTVRSSDFDRMLRWEYNMARWLESQGYDVTYVTNVDVHSNSGLLGQHEVFLSVGHDEYWSMEERNHVEQARDAGSPTNLGFFCANSAYWRVRFENSGAGQANRVMACYKGEWAQDPVAPTNKFRSPENNKPENALLGIMYTGDRTVVYGGYDFVVSNSSDPYYANTGLNNGDKLTLLVGFEWDGIVNNGFTPPGLVTLGASTVNPETTDGDVAGQTNYQISNAVKYTAPSGAKVFSTGSIQWVWGLDSDGVQTPREDLRAKQIAVNVLADMGAKPQTPGAGIIVPT
ncbi:MAG: DUF4082 domain-containing protein [Desmonostoc vinosum HA7617-LM4]|jgi:hypothetical protein|nr:DUF4082 domain-containing protein [Desmonostoc vinosum HA7617-LM4]